MSDSARDLLVRGIASAKAGERDEARRYLEWALRQGPSPDEQIEAWLWLSEITQGREEARAWLEEVLAHDPHNPRALRRVALLDGRLRPEQIIDPDHPPAGAPPGGPVEVERFCCPSCGGQVAYAPNGIDLQCDHCGTRLRVPSGESTSEPEAEDFVLALATARGHGRAQASPTFACTACGVRFLLAPQTLSLTCPYCNATYVVEESEERQLIRPQAIVPLAVSLEEAGRRLTAWQGGSGEGAPLAIDRLTAVYLPIWLFEMGGIIEWSVERGEGGWSGGDRPQSGTEPPASPIAVLACSRSHAGLAAVVENTDPRLLVAFESSYLAGCPAETYTLSMADAALRARERALRVTGARLAATWGGIPLSLRSARMMVVSCLLALVPVWMADVRIGETTRQLIVSGVTGQVSLHER